MDYKRQYVTLRAWRLGARQRLILTQRRKGAKKSKELKTLSMNYFFTLRAWRLGARKDFFHTNKD